ncbi:L-asparagine transporter-like permease [Streptomyces sp. V4I8]
MTPVGVFGTLDARSHEGRCSRTRAWGSGERAGFVAGWMAMLDYLLIPAVAYLFSGVAMNALVPEVSRWVLARTRKPTRAATRTPPTGSAAS